MGAMTNSPEASTSSQGDRVLSLIRTKYPHYHPLMAIAEIAHEKDVDAKTALDCHKTIAKYVQPELRSIDVKGNITETRRVIVSLFDEGELSADGTNRSVTYGADGKSLPSADSLLTDIEGSAMTFLDSPAVTMSADPIWENLIAMEAA